MMSRPWPWLRKRIEGLAARDGQLTRTLNAKK